MSNVVFFQNNLKGIISLNVLLYIGSEMTRRFFIQSVCIRFRKLIIQARQFKINYYT
jgi:hypothetical protein